MSSICPNIYSHAQTDTSYELPQDMGVAQAQQFEQAMRTKGDKIKFN